MRTPRRLLRSAGTALLVGGGVFLLAAVLAALIVGAVGGNPAQALRAILAGALGTPAGLTESLLKTTPLLFTGLAVSVAFRAGLWNIGAEGQFLVGMLGAAATTLLLPPLPPLLACPVALLAGTVAGSLWAAVPAFLKLRREVPEVISTIMLNFLAVYLVQYLVRGPLKDPASANDWSPLLPTWSHLPRLRAIAGVGRIGGESLRLPAGEPILAVGLDAGRLHLGVLLGLLVVALVWACLARSTAGFQMRVVGLNLAAARAAGLPVTRTLVLAFLSSGALAGLGGAVEVLGLIQRMYRYDPGAPGYGFTGVAVALLGGLHPLGVLASAFFFGALTVGCNQMQRTAGISFQVAYVIQAALVLLMVSLPRLRGWSARRRASVALEGQE